ncbi:PDZ and LIM domain protein Zasp isoform X2 [Hermetia illucens]|uniref:PDZ and LIM domain protein Zasp isoform X2 n=1 Tax=Hermetia illucens TaxID=343691 RepID=UPI0018CC55DB|nr:PDZ and LIM domain protein Zasp isoform X2 [Hermetia illucens]
MESPQVADGDMAGQLSTIRLSRYDAQPWGFRLQGGLDFGTPLIVQKVNGGSLAEQAGLLAGDALLKVNNVDVYNMRHKDAQDLIVRSGNSFDITIQRGGSVWRPQVTPTGSLPSPSSHIANSVPTVTKTSLSHKPQEVRHIGSGYNSAARPFSSVNGSDGQVKSIVNKQYNTPVGIYSEEAIAETLSAQAEVLAGGVLGVNFKKNEKIYNAANSEVLKMLHEQENDPEPESHAPANFFWTASHAVGGAAGVKSHHREEDHHQPQPLSSQRPHEDERIGTLLLQNTLAPGAAHRPSLPTPAPAPAPTFSSYGPESTYQPQPPAAPAPILSSYGPESTYQPQPPAAPAPTLSSYVPDSTYQPQPPSAPAPSSAPPASVPTPGAPASTEVNPKTGGGMACDSCGVSIAGVFVRIKDKNLHSECFKCATCGTNLKNQGYFNFNNKLYCDIHARLAAMNNPPKGTEGYTPVPIKPATKLSASTISAALDSHTQHNGSGHESNANITSIMSPLSHTHSRTSSSSSSIHSSAGISSSHSTMSSLSPDKSTMSPEKLSPAHSRQSSENGSTNVFGHHQLHPISGAGAIRTNSRTMSPVMSSPPPPPPPPLPFDSISPPAATITYSNELTINHKRNENDVNNGSKINNNGVVECSANGGQKPNNGGCISNGYTNGGHDSHSGSINGAPETGGDSGQHVLPQTNVYNKFLKKYANKMQSDFLDGSNHKSNPATTPSTTTRPTEITTSKSDKINDSSENNNLVKMASTLSTPFSSTTNGYVENGESIYGTIRPESRRKSNEDFKYVTLDGSVIRSVIPPGKGVKTNYKLNTGYGGPKPFNSSPMSPPMRGPQSPSTYPPPTSVQSWDQPRSQPKSQINPYATLPRTTGHSQGRFNTYKPGFNTYRGNTNLAPAPSLPAIADDNPQISRKVGDADTFDLPPPPPPLPGALSTVDSQSQAVKPVKTVSTTGNRTAKPFRPGPATEMLTSTLEKVDINDKQKFRDEAGKIISAMLESRLAQQTNQSLTKDLDTDHPMKKIIDVCDKPQPNQHSVDVSGEANGKQTAGLTLEVSPDGKILSGSPTEFGPSESVVYRNKSTNPTGKRELSTHAFDRRSYIDTNSNNQETSNPEVNGNTENTTTLVSDLKDGKEPVCCQCNTKITRGPFITALGRIWCPDHFVCVNANCRRPLQDIGFVEEKGELYCEFCFERYLAPTCSKCANKIKGDCLNAIGKHYHPECFTCSYCGKLFGNSPFFLEEGEPYCEADWNELFTTKCFACGFPVEAGDRWVEALNHNYHSQCFNCTMCKKNLEGQSFYNKGGRPFCKNHAR